jgi:arsenite oxidase small subunit
MNRSTSRRDFLKSTAAGSAGAVAAISSPSANARPGETPLASGYPVLPIATEKQIRSAAVSQFHYPDRESPCLLIKTGAPVPGGVGPDGDIVAFSAMCTHMGCIVAYDDQTRTLKCPCHFSVFDAEQAGQMVCGQATANLPQILLHFDERSRRVSAVGVEGQLYGRLSNIL